MDLIELKNRTAQEVFEELKYRLNGMGYLPDEYFLMDCEWENGRKIPEGADIFCTTDYGASEGVYLDVYLKWYEDNKPVTKSFITGKTLGENGNDLDRMFLTSSAITKAFHGDHGTYARFLKIDGQDDTGGAVLYLSHREQRTLADSLKTQLEQLGQQGQDAAAVEQLLRRVTGMGITEQTADLQISDYEKARLAIRDGDVASFKVHAAKVLEETDNLLVEAAGRPGAVGRELTSAALSDRKNIDYQSYCAACKKAMDIYDVEKTLFLLNWAEHCVAELEPSFYGEMAQYEYWEHLALSQQIIHQCTPEQIAAAPSSLLYAVTMQQDFSTARELVEKGISGGENSWRILNMITCGNENNAVDVAKQLLKNGMDFEKFQDWAETHYWGDTPETLQALSDCWQEIQSQQQEPAPEAEQGGMTFG